MAPYIPPSRKRFVVPKKILEAASKAQPLPTTIFPFEELPADILVYLFSEHVNLPDLICLCLSCKRFLHLLTSIDATAASILHYHTEASRQTALSRRSISAPNDEPPSDIHLFASAAPTASAAAKLKHDPSPQIIPVLHRLQSHNILPRGKVACHSCCRVRRIGTKSHWWDICEEVYSDVTWRRRRNNKTWADRRVIDYEYHEFHAAFVWAWKMWEKHRPGSTNKYLFMETAEGGYEIEETVQDRRAAAQKAIEFGKPLDEETVEATRALERLRIREGPKPICPECWGRAESRKINARPPLRY